MFTDLLERAYVGRIEAYNDEKFVYLKEKLDGDFAETNSKIVTRKGEQYSLNYKLHLVNGDWKADLDSRHPPEVTACGHYGKELLA